MLDDPSDARLAGAALKVTQLGGRPPPRPPGLESGAAATDLSDDRRRASMEALRRALAHDVVESLAVPLGQEEADVVLREADEGLRRLAAEGPAAELSPGVELALEAVIVTDGSRPAPFVRDGFLDTTDERLGRWADDLREHEAAIRRAIASTGRILRGGDTGEQTVYGTAWMIAPGLIATAQHVLEELYAPHGDTWIEKFGGEITVDFGVEDSAAPAPERRLRVVGVEQPSTDRINRSLNLGNLDAAILRLAEDGPEAPPPFRLSKTLAFDGAVPVVHVVGHPARPLVAPADPGTDPDRPLRLTAEIVSALFGDRFGVKRWAPGQIVLGPGSLPGDAAKRVMTHDASTLAGNSGSPVFDLSAVPDRVVGLHFAGEFRKENYCHPTQQIREHLERPGVVFE